MNLNTYLTFDGNCEQAFEFYRSVFGGDYLAFSRFSEMPPSVDFEVNEAFSDRVMHVSLPISQTSTLMGSDTAGEKVRTGNNFSISVNNADPVEAQRIFEALSNKGTVTMPMEKTFWNAYFGTVIDQFGIQWMINCDLNQES